MRILVTGARGFIGRNVTVRLAEHAGYEVLQYTRESDPAELPELVKHAEAIIHLAGINRPRSADEFEAGNAYLTARLCDTVRRSGFRGQLILASSTQAELDNPYGRSKLDAERHVLQLAGESHARCVIYRLPGVFGKWCRPNYNSVVATFCHNIANGLEIQVRDPAAEVNLVHVDDVVDEFLKVLATDCYGAVMRTITPQYTVSLGDLAEQIQRFKRGRDDLVIERVGKGFLRALYSTYVSYLPKAAFAYEVPVHQDPRGRFVEMLKTHDSGQMSFFSAGPGITRGGHYHHTKTEKFLVIRGRARFRFRHILTNDYHELETCGEQPCIVETIPGWSHDITNVGSEEMLVMLWANEIFDRARPDTVARGL